MPRLSKGELAAFIVATLAGSCLHFVHTLLPCPLTALFAPVNESLWEHVKILFWPGLAAALLLRRRGDPVPAAARCLALVLCCLAMVLLGWVYHVVLGGDSLGVDVGMYVLLMAAVFLLPRWGRWQALARRLGPGVWAITAALAAAVLLFTFLPPGAVIFTDLSAT